MAAQRYRVLLLEDSPWDAHAAEDALARSTDGPFETFHAPDVASAKVELAHHEVDAFLVDLNLPDSAGEATLQWARQAAAGRAPVIVLSGSWESPRGPFLVSEGADDYLVKDKITPGELGRAVRYAIERYRAHARENGLARRMQDVMDAMPDLVSVMDTRGRFVQWNQSFPRITGLTPAELGGLDVRRLIAPEDLAAAEAGMAKALRGDLDHETRVHIVTKDGRAIPYLFSGAPLKDRAGEVIGLVGVGKDVQEFVDAHAAQMRTVRAESEAATLRELDVQRGKFFNMMAHEVNNPLGVIVMQVDLLRDGLLGELTAPQQKAIEVLERTLDRLRALTADLLDVARMQSGDLKLRVAPTDLRAIADEMIETYGVLAQEKGLALQVAGAATLPIAADRRRIAQVFVNYLMNAFKFTPRGGSVTIDLGVEAGAAVLRVRDTGAGLTREQMAKLFAPFSQARAEDANKGTGLGLHISKAIVTAHGGSVGCESDGPGKGTTFWLRLPLREGDGPGK